MAGYVESAKAKGFWIGIFLMPAMIFLSISAPMWLEKKATPVRCFVIVDQSGTLVRRPSLDWKKPTSKRARSAQ